MAWNGSNNTGSVPGKREAAAPTKSDNSSLTYFIIFAVAIAVAAAVYFALRGNRGGQSPGEQPEPSGGKIAEATPATNRAESVKPPAKPLTLQERRQAEIRLYEKKYGTNMPPGVKARVHFLKNPPEKVYKIKNRFEFLRHPSERQIASLMSVTPGDFMLSPPEYGTSFDNDFLSAIMEKIDVLPDDDEETRAVKAAVTDLKKEIVAIQRERGMLPSEIMNEHGKYLYELGQIEQDLERELLKAKNDPNMADQDVEDLFVAANKIRQEKGLPEWKVPDFSKRMVRLQRKLARRGQNNDSGKDE